LAVAERQAENDRNDALKIAQLSAVNQLSLVHVPQIDVRQWRALIAYRHHLVRRRTKIKNHIRDLLLREGQLQMTTFKSNMANESALLSILCGWFHLLTQMVLTAWRVR
jgi:transposase